jgi:hypothetical protein
MKCFVALFSLAVMIFAGVAFCQVDTTGALYSPVVGAIEKVPLIGQYAVQIYGALLVFFGGFLVRVLQTVLKKIPTTWYWNDVTRKLAVNLFWRLVSWILGRSILYYNAEPATEEATIPLSKKVEAHLEKHSPALAAAADALSALKK